LRRFRIAKHARRRGRGRLRITVARGIHGEHIARSAIPHSALFLTAREVIEMGKDDAGLTGSESEDGSQESAVRSRESGGRRQEAGVRSQGSGVGSQESDMSHASSLRGVRGLRCLKGLRDLKAPKSPKSPHADEPEIPWECARDGLLRDSRGPRQALARPSSGDDGIPEAPSV
jgi:hypothetical protein